MPGAATGHEERAACYALAVCRDVCDCYVWHLNSCIPDDVFKQVPQLRGTTNLFNIHCLAAITVEKS